MNPRNPGEEAQTAPEGETKTKSGDEADDPDPSRLRADSIEDLVAAELDAFQQYVEENYPPGCVISNPSWHAPKLFRAAARGIIRALKEALGDEQTVFVQVDRELLPTLGQWSAPVQLRVAREADLRRVVLILRDAREVWLVARDGDLGVEMQGLYLTEDEAKGRCEDSSWWIMPLRIGEHVETPRAANVRAYRPVAEVAQ